MPSAGHNHSPLEEHVALLQSRSIVSSVMHLTFCGQSVCPLGQSSVHLLAKARTSYATPSDGQRTRRESIGLLSCSVICASHTRLVSNFASQCASYTVVVSLSGERSASKAASLRSAPATHPVFWVGGRHQWAAASKVVGYGHFMEAWFGGLSFATHKKILMDSTRLHVAPHTLQVFLLG